MDKEGIGLDGQDTGVKAVQPTEGEAATGQNPTVESTKVLEPEQTEGNIQQDAGNWSEVVEEVEETRAADGEPEVAEAEETVMNEKDFSDNEEELPKLDADLEEEKPANEEKKVKEKSVKPPQKSHTKRNILLILLGVLILIAGVAAGIFWQKRNDVAQKPTENIIVQGSWAGGGGGVPLKDVALVARDDKLMLAFLKMHNTKENSCYSPLSVRYALEMLSAGAEGETKAQIDNLLGDVKATRYENVADHLSVANSLWVNDAWYSRLQPGYKEVLKSEFDAEIKVDTLQSAANVNRWIEDKSFGMLQDTLDDSDVQGLDALLANVLAIDMRWEKEYEPGSTYGQYFNYDYAKRDDNQKYSTMSISTSGTTNSKRLYYNFANEATVFAQDLKEYNGTQLQFVAIMPQDLSSYIETVTNEKVNDLLTGLREAKGQNENYDFYLTAYLPKFSIEGGLKGLVKDLQSLGMTDAFVHGEADFSKMFGESDFAIDTMKQNTKFDLSEEGIRAAAVTIAGGRGAGGDGPIPSSVHIVVSINKPFMYLVRDVKTGEVWFVGTVYEPNRWDDEEGSYRY